jgi:hypothetical protein
MILKQALYGLKSADASWRVMFSNLIIELGFKETIVDYDAYIQRNFRKKRHILVYVDDVLCQ